jgi:hypothetical protein
MNSQQEKDNQQFVEKYAKKRGHHVINSNNILPIVTKDNSIFELQGLLEHNDFTNEPVTIKTNVRYVSNQNN